MEPTYTSIGQSNRIQRQIHFGEIPNTDETDQASQLWLENSLSLHIEEHIKLLAGIFAEKARLEVELNSSLEELDRLEEQLSEKSSWIKKLRKSFELCNETEKQKLNKQLAEGEQIKNQLESCLKDIEDQCKQLDKKLNLQTKKLEEKEKLFCLEFNYELGVNIIKQEDLPVKFSQLSSSFCSPEHLAYVIDIGIIALKNLSKFILEAKRFLEENKILILKEFSKEEIKNIHDVEIYLELLGADSHHGGKTPLLVKFTSKEGEELVSLVYKPRGAETDKAIIDLFRDLNALSANYKSGPDLPVYEIVDLQTHSLWQYIDGIQWGHQASKAQLDLEEEVEKELADLQSKDDQQGLQRAWKKKENLKIARNNLERLESICFQAGITDLHHQNVKLTGIEADKYLRHFTFKEEGDYKWVPIDLEIVEQGHITGLYERSNEADECHARLTEAEKDLIDQFTQSQEKRLSRFVPIPTATFQELMIDLQAVESIPLKVVNALQETWKCEILELEKLKRLLFESIKNGDIPFFTKRGEFIYYETTEITVAKIRK